MAAHSSGSQPSPAAIMEELGAYQRSQALKGAIDLDLFTHIDDGARTVSDIAARTGANQRGVRILCDFLTIHGHLTKQDGAYGLTVNSKTFLSKRSPAYLGSVANFALNPMTMANFSDIAGAVRKGGTVNPVDFLTVEHPVWLEFARSMTPVAAQTGKLVAQALASKPASKVLDIAASHGMYGIAVAQRNPAAQITGQDAGPVLTMAVENARKAGIVERYKTLPGSVFEIDLGSGYDLVLLPNFIHGFDTETNVGLMKKIHGAMQPGGRLAIVEYVPNPDRISPPSAGFSLTMLAATKGGDTYTFAELEEMLRRSGFHDAQLHELSPAPHRLVVGIA
jgi:O-methyltransferase domain/Dimerisation domain